ncbi:MAG: DUF4299 domain-containing protein, partial [Gammaproteobacteria bacterium]|nr:DUF4299 domain-containing protein [Gammaproteobacteria bacterium]
MSYSFHVSDIAAPDLKQVLASLPYDDVHADVTVPDSGWPECAHLHREGVSVRPVETSLEGNTVAVRIFSGAAPDDYRLGLDIVANIAAVHGRAIESEDGLSVSVDELDAEYGDDWIENHSRDTFNAILDMYHNDASELQIQGVNATMRLGPRMVKSLHDSADQAQAFYRCFRRLNYIANDDVFVASTIVVLPPDTDKVARLATLAHGVPTLLSTRAKFLALSDPEEGENLCVPFKDFVTRNAHTLTWLSEDAVLTEGQTGPAWVALVNS